MYWHALGWAKDLGVEIEVPIRPTIAAVDLQQLAVPDQGLESAAKAYQSVAELLTNSNRVPHSGFG